MRISGVIEESIVDGPGIRVVFFLQGCKHRCPGCHNPGTHSMNGGQIWSLDEVEKVIDSNPHTDGITLSGGDPFFQIEATKDIVQLIRKKYDLSILVYTGFLIEDLMLRAEEDNDLSFILNNIDVLIDGPFVLEKRDLSLQYRGSSNQRIIDMKATMQNKTIVLLNSLITL